jgi:hypothetical protein
MVRWNVAIGIVCGAFLACAGPSTVVRHNTTADARPFQPNNMPVGDTVAVDATADGLKLRENGRTKAAQPDTSEPAPAKSSTGTPSAAVPADPDDGE